MDDRRVPAHRFHRDYLRKVWRSVPCPCCKCCSGQNLIILHIARRLAFLRHARNPQEHQGAPRNAGGHQWTPRGARERLEFHYPHNLVVETFAWRLLHALRKGTLAMKAVCRLLIRPNSLNGGRVRPGVGDHILTSRDEFRQPEVLAVEMSIQLRGPLSVVARNFPRETAHTSTWVLGRSFQWVQDSLLLVTQPFRGGRANMRLPELKKLHEWNGHPLVHVAEPALVDHRCSCLCRLGEVVCVLLASAA